MLQIAPSGYWRHAAQQRSPALRCQRVQRDGVLSPHIERVWQANMRVYGADKVWKRLNREGISIARCTVERLMKRLGLQGVRRGKVVRTTISDGKAPCPLDRVNRVFKADRPNQLWVSDFTYVSTWQGWQYVAFVIDVYARRIVGWRVSSSMRTDFVLNALEQALYARQPLHQQPECKAAYPSDHHDAEACSPWADHVRRFRPVFDSSGSGALWPFCAQPHAHEPSRGHSLAPAEADEQAPVPR